MRTQREAMCTQYTNDNGYTKHKQQCSRDRVLKKARTRPFNYKNIRDTVAQEYKNAKQNK